MMLHVSAADSLCALLKRTLCIILLHSFCDFFFLRGSFSDPGSALSSRTSRQIGPDVSLYSDATEGEVPRCGKGVDKTSARLNVHENMLSFGCDSRK